MNRIRRHLTFANVVSLIALFVAGCGGGDESGYTENDIAGALGFRPGHGERAHETLYERAPARTASSSGSSRPRMKSPRPRAWLATFPRR